MSAMIALAERRAIIARCERIVRRSLNLGSVRKIDTDRHFFDHLGADSLAMVTITVGVEEEFGFPVSDDEAGSIETFGDLVALVERLMPHSSPAHIAREGAR